MGLEVRSGFQLRGLRRAQPSVTVSVPAPPSRRPDKRGHVYQWQPWIVARIPKALTG
jgi:hypothetical protein